jgi:hypothetical protein
LILESIAKRLNPEINILKCAIPYFKYVQPNASTFAEENVGGDV